MTPSFREILQVLNQHHVEYIVVGGVAAALTLAQFRLKELLPIAKLGLASVAGSPSN